MGSPEPAPANKMDVDFTIRSPSPIAPFIVPPSITPDLENANPWMNWTRRLSPDPFGRLPQERHIALS